VVKSDERACNEDATDGMQRDEEMEKIWFRGSGSIRSSLDFVSGYLPSLNLGLTGLILDYGELRQQFVVKFMRRHESSGNPGWRPQKMNGKRHTA
jgi:hypothetical protein